MDIGSILALVIGTVLGAVLGWLGHAHRSASAENSGRVDSAQLRAELDVARGEADALRAQIQEIRAENEHRLEQAERRTSEAREHGERQLAEARAQSERLLAQVREDSERRVAEAKGDQERAAHQFQALANRALESSNKQFLDLAEERLKQSSVQHNEELDKRELAFRALVDPINKSLDKVSSEVTEQEKRRIEFDSRLTESLRNLSETHAELRKGTGDLVTALRSSQQRGAWGELQLQRVVEAAGMLNRVDFDLQVQTTNNDGETLRPDMVVHLAGGKDIVVDSKVAFLGYLEAQQADDPQVRAERMAAHARHVRKHVDDLASKRYRDLFDNVPEFVVMFVPAEAFLAAALDQDSSLWEYAARKNVILATPATLLAMLRTIAYSWRQQALADNALQVLKIGKELHERLVTMTGHVTKMGSSLARSTKAYNEMVGSLESRVLVSARKMIELDVVDAKESIGELKGVEELPRQIASPELLAADEGGVVAIDAAREVTELAASDQRALAEADEEKHTRPQASGS